MDPADGMDAVDVAHSLLPPSSEATAQVEVRAEDGAKRALAGFGVGS